MNVKKLKTIRSYCRIQRFDERVAVDEFNLLSIKHQSELLEEMKVFIKNKRLVGSRGRKVSAERSDFTPLVSTDTVISC